MSFFKSLFSSSKSVPTTAQPQNGTPAAAAGQDRTAQESISSVDRTERHSRSSNPPPPQNPSHRMVHTELTTVPGTWRDPWQQEMDWAASTLTMGMLHLFATSGVSSCPLFTNTMRSELFCCSPPPQRFYLIQCSPLNHQKESSGYLLQLVETLCDVDSGLSPWGDWKCVLPSSLLCTLCSLQCCVCVCVCGAALCQSDLSSNNILLCAEAWLSNCSVQAVRSCMSSFLFTFRLPMIHLHI